MSEETDSSATVSENEEAQAASEPAGKPGKMPWMKIVAVIVVVMLVSTALYFFVLSGGNKTLSASITPSPAAVDAGTSMKLNVTVKYGDTTLTDKDAKLMWTVEPTTMGDFDIRSKSSVTLSASSKQDNGTLKCTVTYKGKTVEAKSDLQIRPPGLDRAAVSPAEIWVKYNASQVFTARGISTIGQNITNLNFSWVATGLPSSSYQIVRKNDTAIIFTAKAVAGNVTLNATATYKEKSRTGSGLAKVTEYPPVRTVDYRWYDLFNVPFGTWYPRRAQYYGGADYEMNWTDKYPYIYVYYGDNAHLNMYLYANMRLNVTAMNLPDVNMKNPEFLPLFAPKAALTGAGTAVLNWHMQYDDPTWVDENYGAAATMYNDGWFVNLTGTTTLDKNAAMDVTGMSAQDWDNFPSWWASNGILLRDKWSTWLVEEQANGKFDIYNMYNAAAQGIGWGLQGQKIGDKLVITIYFDGWGMEALMSRWLRDAFMPTELYMEGFWMNATIGPQTSNIFITTAVEYGVYAFMSRNETLAQDNKLVWLWKPIHQDYQVSSGEHPVSEYDKYAQSPYTYKNWCPGSSLYGTDVPYDIVPCAWNLSDNETMSFTWPSGNQQFIMDKGVPGQVTNVTGKLMAISYAEPMPGDTLVATPSTAVPGTAVIDTTQRLLTYTGPIDFWDWSRNQSAANHQILKQHWEDVAYTLLPESVPYVEFGMASEVEPPQIDHFVISQDDLPLVGTPTTVTVTAYDQFDRVFAAYVGSVQFASNRSSEVTLPTSGLQYAAGDNGIKTFPVTYNVAGWFNLTVADTVKTTATGWCTDIMAISVRQEIKNFTVSIALSIVAGTSVDVTVTAWNQYDRVFHEYNGTVTFSSNDSMALLPNDYMFKSGELGFHKFQGNVTFSAEGTYYLMVADVSNLSANGTAANITVLGSSEEHFRIYDMFEQPWGTYWFYRWPTYGTDVVLSNTPGNYTMIYYWGGDESIWAPYRMSINATNVSNVNVRNPMLMPVMDSNTTFANSSATIDVYFQYLTWAWWNDTWVPKWSSDPDWFANSMSAQLADGWYLGVEYNVTMNRETAQQWMRLPVTLPETDIAAWWATNASSYKKNWRVWMMDQLNNVSDIYNAYEFPGTVTGPYANLEVLANGDVHLDLAMVNWGYEILTLKWMTERGICPHQPYIEDVTMVLQETNRKTNLTFDGACLYAMKAQGANQSAGHAGMAWAWEALRIDYVASSPNHPYSDYDRFVGLVYESWNAGDMWFGMVDAQDAYETTPGWFNLTMTQDLTFQLPMHDVIGYIGRAVSQADLENITYGGYPYGPGSLFDGRSDYSGYDLLVRYGQMSLGYYITNLVPGATSSEQPLDLASMYNATTKTLTIHGPHNFDNSGRGFGNAMYHGAPWIEFNVTPTGGMSMTTSTPAPAVNTPASSEPTLTVEMVSMIAAVLASLAALVVIAVDQRRRD